MRDKINDPARLSLMADAIGNIVSKTRYFVTLSREYVTNHPQIDWAAIEGLRHVLVHDYYQVNMETIWGIIQQDIPALKTFLKTEA